MAAAAGVLTVGTVFVVALVTLMPVSVAYVCPSCYGLERVAPGVFLERGAGEQDAENLLASMREAERRVSGFYPERLASPVFLVCASEACDRRLGGKGAKAQTYGASFVHVSAAGHGPAILAHEAAHAEFHARVGTWRLLQGAVPAWFDEGLAVVISRDRRYLAGSGDEPACLQPTSRDLPDSVAEWGPEAGRGERPIYAMAACRVLGWLERHGGPEAVADLAGRLASGGAFAE